MKRFLCLAMGLAWATNALAITVDGTVDAGYGAAVSVQAVETGFGNALPPGILGGSELDAAYAKFEGGRLYLMLTGNHEPNFNKLEVFIDSIAGGENVMTGTPQYDYFDGSIWISQNFNTMVFDTGFDVDYHLFSRWGSGTAGYEVDFVNRQGGVNAMVPGSSETSAAAVGLIASGVVPAGDVGPNASGTALTQNLEFAINNNNAAGVDGCDGNGCLAADQTAAQAVTTGMEFSIALADIGNPAPGSTIRIAAIVNNSNHSYLSNQSLGPFVPAPLGQHNPGGNGNNPGDQFNGGGFTGTMAGMNFNNYAGDQFFSLTIPAAPGVPGDYNSNGVVDGADYVVYRDHLGTAFALPNEVSGTTPGQVTPEDYAAWRARFGNISGSGSGLGSSSIPEPTTLMLLMTGALVILGAARRK